MFRPGLVSITFRQLSPLEIVKLVASAELEAIEWGGDIHVPHGDIAKAKEVRALTLEHGLKMAAYGSYYRAGKGDQEFEPILETAATLGNPTIRVWAGTKDFADATTEEKRAVAEDLRRIASLAEVQGISISLEFHGGTIANGRDAVCTLLQEVSHPNLKTFWQPGVGHSLETGLAEIDAFIPHISGLHVFQWNVYERRPFEEGTALWKEYLSAAQKQPGDLWALLEFVENDAPENFLRDAATFKQLLRTVQP